MYKEKIKKQVSFFILLTLLSVPAVLADAIPSYLNKKEFDGTCAPEERLEIINVLYKNFNGEYKLGTMKTLDTIAPSLIDIFNKLYDVGYEINLINSDLVPEGLSAINDNDNTYSFECRNITGGSLPSIHAYGGAIDLNPRENPYIHFSKIDGTENYRPDYVIPESGWAYITRDKYREGKPVHKGIITTEIVDAFKENGILRWGGDWNNPIDYQHFEIYRDNSILFLTMTKDESIEYFNKYKNFYNSCKAEYPVEYSERKFVDLSKAIAIKNNETPVEIYLNYGVEKLYSVIDELSVNLSYNICVADSKLQSMNIESNAALNKINKLRSISSSEM